MGENHMCYNKVVHTKPGKRQQAQRSMHAGQAVFMLAMELQLPAQTVCLGLDIISHLFWSTIQNKQLLNYPSHFCMLICKNTRG